MEGYQRRINIKLALLLAAGVIALSLLVVSGPAMGTITGDQPPSTGDWVIDQPTRVTGESITVHGNLTINDVLTIDTSTITMNLSSDGAVMVNVTSTGDLVMTDSTITSIDEDLEYGFEVHGRMDVQRSNLEECYMGVRVLTNKTVTMADSNILECSGAGLYLKNADGATVRDVNIHSNDFGMSTELTVKADVDYGYNYIYTYLSIVHIEGGKPTLEGVDISVNGSVTIEAWVEKSVYYNYVYYYIYCGAVLIDGIEFDTVEGIYYHDSSVSVKVLNTVYNTYVGSCYMYVNTYLYSQACVFKTFKDLNLSGFEIDNIADNYPIIQNTYKDNPVTFYGSSYYYKELFSLSARDDYSDAGPHDLKVKLKDTTFRDTAILSFDIQPTYSGPGTPTFNVELSMDNLTVEGSGVSDMIYFYLYPQFATMKTFNVNINITNCSFSGVQSRILYEYIYRGTGAQGALTFELNENVRVENCEFRNCTGSSYMFYSYGYNYGEINNIRDRVWAFRNNTWEDNSVGSYMMYMYGGYDISRGLEWFIFEDNVIRRTTASSYLIYAFGWERLVWRNNLFIDNDWYIGAYLNDYGGYSSGSKPARWWILNNTWQDCTSSYPYEYIGMLYLYGSWDLEVAGNKVTECSSTFMSIYEYTYYSATKPHLKFHDNLIWNNSGPVVYMYGYSTYHEDLILEIYDNTAWDCSGMLVTYYDTTYVDSYDYDATVTIRNNDVTNFTGVVFRAYGDLTIVDNDITDCVGYVFELNALNKHIPTISRNRIVNCENVYSVTAKVRGSFKISITMSDLSVKCTGNAFRFENVDITLINVTISDEVGLGIIADASNVDLVDSLMPVGSGQIVGDGSINVWFNIEANVFWGNSQGEESETPVSEAIIIFTGSQGLYYTSTYSDENGHMRPKRVLNWNMDGPFVTIWTPYTVTIAKQGMSNSVQLELDQSYVGPNAAHLVLWDTSDPYIQLVSPMPNTLISVENLTVLGFATELGSGIDVLEISINDGPAYDMDIDENGDFLFVFTDVPQGDLEVTATVRDRATNSNQTVLRIRIDRTPPSLRILDPPPGHTTNEEPIQVRAEIEEGATVVINALEWGVSPGSISVDFPLSEGLNIITIEATDEAGNVAIEVRTVFLDTIAPSLTLFAPRDMSLTKMTSVIVEGEAEVGSIVTISVYRSDTDIVDEPVTIDEEGLFSHRVDLSEGVNRIEVKVEDTAGNYMTLSRTVTVDTTAPDCGIDQPVDGYKTNEETVLVKGWADTGNVLVYLNGKQVFSTGTIERIVRLHEGENVITLSVVDVIGNEYSHSVKVIMDSTAPVIQISTPVETSILTNMPTIRFVGRIDGEYAGMTANGEAVTVEDGAFDLLVPVAQNTRSDIVLVVYDGAGNVRRYSVTVDHSTALPPISVEFSPGGSVVKSPDGNLYITGVTTELVKEVVVRHESELGSYEHTYGVRESLFSILLGLDRGDNTIVLEVTDIYGNTNSTAPYQVVYDPPKVVEDEGDEVTISPQNLGLVLLVIAVTLFITAVIVTRSLKGQRRE